MNIVFGTLAVIVGFVGLWATAPSWVAYLVALLVGLFALTVERLKE